jgi:hypothetical protein
MRITETVWPSLQCAGEYDDSLSSAAPARTAWPTTTTSRWTVRSIQHLSSYWWKATCLLPHTANKFISLSQLASESSSCSTFNSQRPRKRFYLFPRAKHYIRQVAKSFLCITTVSPYCHLQYIMIRESNSASCQTRGAVCPLSLTGRLATTWWLHTPIRYTHDSFSLVPASFASYSDE